MKFQVPRGTRDILPGEIERWHWLEERTRAAMALYGYREVRTPLFEATELFVRSVGESTDIVRKELYTFQDRKGRSLTLRPEGTAPLVRAYLENPALRAESPARLYYMGPMFRYERPQAGRYRQFWQIGAELLGSARPEADAEMIDLFRAIMGDVGLKKATVLLNSLGDSVCRPRYREAIRQYFKKHADRLCGDCKERLDTNPLRILDCKVPSCAPVIAGAPSVLDSLCAECAEHFEAVKRALTGLGIPYEVEPRLVRGLDYYTRTVFEIHAAGLGAQNAVGGGGRYDQLVKDFGGPDTPAIGFSIGMERLLLAAGEGAAPPSQSPDVCVIALEPGAQVEAQALARSLRGQLEEPETRKGLRVVVDVTGRSANSQMKWASKTGARWAVFVPKGADGYAVRNMAAGRDEGTQRTVEDLRRWLLGRQDLVESPR
ncbi:MAG: histidine--tRNA ligase [Candidatus Eisenbacteria bacterium]|uniref:Histidine--tRNA ligase n=1 Tax=Eiseniibacteriota bacterium TaxID=2212470 RepID=A0A538T3Q1_UNCEI|nr:MAG: histidine--tRNA ligase [Candidatus Eisenbacteria bacterium]